MPIHSLLPISRKPHALFKEPNKDNKKKKKKWKAGKKKKTKSMHARVRKEWRHHAEAE